MVGEILFVSLYVSLAILLVAAFGVFYSVSRLFNVSRRIRLSLVITAAVLTTAHQLLVHWHFELPAVIYYITAFFTNFFFYILPAGLIIGIYLVVRVLIRSNDTPVISYIKKKDATTEVTGLSTGLSAHSLLDATLNAPEIIAQQQEIKLHPKLPRAAYALICETEPSGMPTVSEKFSADRAGCSDTATLATAETAPDTEVESSSVEKGITVERSTWFTGEEMVITSSGEGTEVSFNARTSGINQIPYQPDALAKKSDLALDGVNLQTKDHTSHISPDIPAIATAAVNTAVSAHSLSAAQGLTGSSLLDGHLNLNQKQRELLAQIRTTIDSTRHKKRFYMRLLSGAKSRFISDSSVSDSTTAATATAVSADNVIGSIKMSPFVQDQSHLTRQLVRMDAEGKMAVIEAEDKSDNSHVLIITGNIPETICIKDQENDTASVDRNASGTCPVPIVQTASEQTENILTAAVATATVASTGTTAEHATHEAMKTAAQPKGWIRFLTIKLGAALFLRLLQTSVVAAACVAVYSTFLALAMPEVNEINVSLDVPAEFDGLDLLQLSDFQDSPIRRKDRATYIYNKVLQMRPALVVITGDFELERMNEPDLRPLMRMNVPYGVYAVGAGSNRELQYEYYRLFDNWDYSFLSNSVRSINIGKEQLNIIGISTEDAEDGNVSVLYTRKIQERGNNFNILLSNSYRYAEGFSAISQDNIDLMLVGNSQDHAKPLLTDYIVNLNRGFVSGLFRPDKNSNLLMYVSSGSQVPDATPSRFGNRTELTHIIIHSTRVPVRPNRILPVKRTPIQPLPDNIPVNDRVIDNTRNIDFYHHYL